MTPTPETTIRVLLKRAAKANAEELPRFIDAINALHKLQAPAAPSADLGALVKRVEALEATLFAPSPRSKLANFR